MHEVALLVPFRSLYRAPTAWAIWPGWRIRRWRRGGNRLDQGGQRGQQAAEIIGVVGLVPLRAVPVDDAQILHLDQFIFDRVDVFLAIAGALRHLLEAGVRKAAA